MQRGRAICISQGNCPIGRILHRSSFPKARICLPRRLPRDICSPFLSSARLTRSKRDPQNASPKWSRIFPVRRDCFLFNKLTKRLTKSTSKVRLISLFRLFDQMISSHHKINHALCFHTHMKGFDHFAYGFFCNYGDILAVFGMFI